MNKQIQELEIVRGIAALYVVLHHSIPHSLTFSGIQFGHLFRFGQEAVMIFFVLSGFVIHLSTAKKEQTFVHYFKKRALRIYCILLPVLLLSYLLQCIKASQMINVELGSFIKNIFMLQDLTIKPNIMAEPYMKNGPLWSLSYEWWFYMVFYPIYKKVRPDKQYLTVASIAILASIVHIFIPSHISRILMYFYLWWTGVELAKVHLKESILSISAIAKIAYPAVAIAVINIINAFMTRMNGGQLRLGAPPLLEIQHAIDVLLVLVSVWIIQRYKLVEKLHFNKVFKPFLFIAPFSYGLYIVHEPLFVQATYFSFITNRVCEIALYLLVTVTTAYFLEKLFYPFVINKIRKRKASMS